MTRQLTKPVRMNKTQPMETKYYLAVDIGASSGRHILAHTEDGKIVLEEIYRFWNGNDTKDGHLVWDTERLFAEVLSGMKKCRELGKIPVSMGIDTWAVDYVLLDGEDRQLGPCYGYRDGRTAGMDEKVYEIIPQSELYARTGIQKAMFNTIYQLMAHKEQDGELLAGAESFLMIPDYLHFRLTGVKKQEYTNATSTQLVNPETNEWDFDLIEKLGYPKKLFKKLSLPGTAVGNLLPEIREQAGFDLTVVLPATHDTGSAVMSVPSNAADVLYISSGTWSLMGCELMKADTSPEAAAANFTNEGGYEYRYRFLKNIMGLWMIQSVKREFEAGWPYEGRKDGEDYGFSHLCEMASLESIDSLVDANDGRFLAPSSMTEEVRAACRESGHEVPETPWQIARVIYRSLADCYRKALLEIESLTGAHYEAINIVGGGSNADWLNELTAEVTGRTVFAGPGEATAIGNLGAQMIADGVFDGLKGFRSCVFKSFGVKQYS